MQNQRTFRLIPAAPSPRSESPERPPRPMTSKQVRKAYKASTKEPAMSRAERYRYEKAEQERIRKEFEREKATAKAKLARDKKKEKELAERQEKKRQGRPLVKVRPSQDTIARFVRGNGTGRKRDSIGETVAVSPVKKDAEEQDWIPNDSGLDDLLAGVPSKDAEDVLQGTGAAEKRELPGKSVGFAEPEADDVAEVTAHEPSDPCLGENDPDDLPVVRTSQKNTAKVSRATETGQEEESRRDVEPTKIADDATEDTGGQLDLIGAESSLDELLAALRSSQDIVAGILRENDSEKKRSPEPDLLPSESSLESLLNDIPASALQTKESQPRLPPSTQAILGNLDDFFPSSSQQRCELEDDIHEDDDDAEAAREDETGATPAEEREPETTTRTGDEMDKQMRRKPFFTPSGSYERFSLVKRMSERDRNLDQLHERDRLQAQIDTISKLETQHTNADHSTSNKENMPMCSQESFGGDWVDDLAVDLII